MVKKQNQKKLLAEICLTNCQIKNLQKKPNPESIDFLFNRRRLERLPSISSSYYVKLSLSLETAISLLKSYKKKKLPLSSNDFKTLNQILNDYKVVLNDFTETAIRVQGLLSIIDEAGLLYRNQKIGAAAQKIAWTTGDTESRNPDADIFMNYVLCIYGKPQTKRNRMEAIEYLQKRFNMQSIDAVVSSLKRTRKAIRKSNPDFTITIPDAQNHTKK